MRNLIICSIIIAVIACVVLLSINFLRSEFHYNNGAADVDFVIYANEDIESKIKEITEGKQRIFFEITKISAVVDRITYVFDIPSSKIYSSSNNFRFEKISFDTDFLKHLEIKIPKDAENGHLFKMKHNTSAEFPTLYFFISDRNYSNYSDFSISWP